MINEANEPSSACRLWRLCQVETSTPPNGGHIVRCLQRRVKCSLFAVAGTTTLLTAHSKMLD